MSEAKEIKAAPAQSPSHQGLSRRMQCIRFLALAAGAACVILGLARGEAAEIFAKAVRICLECIGIG